MKKLLSVMLVCIMLCTLLSVGAGAAATQPDVQPCWDNISYMHLTHGFYDEFGMASGMGTRQTDATGSVGTVTVYKKVNNQWVYVDSWTDSTTRKNLIIEGEFPAISGVEYKSVFTFTVYRGVMGETHTTEYIERCP